MATSFDITLFKNISKKGLSKINYLKSKENETDISIKNTTKEIFSKHANKDVGAINEDSIWI
jgi:hypothetical protein